MSIVVSTQLYLDLGTATPLTITSRVYFADALSTTGDHAIYTVPTGVTSRITSLYLSPFEGAGNVFDISFQVITPTPTNIQLDTFPYLEPRAQGRWDGQINLEAGYGINLFIGGALTTFFLGVYLTGEDFTSPP